LVAADVSAQILIIGQAPGKATHIAGISWHDRSGIRLREWLGVTPEQFYDPTRIAIVPSGLCYPGSGAKGDLPPRPECAPLWHPRIMPLLVNLRLTIYLGTYAFQAKFGSDFRNLSEAAENFRSLLPSCIVLPHPSPRNGMWANQRPWFNKELLFALRDRIREVLA
jgi:uracil-DNA glycosylase